MGQGSSSSTKAKTAGNFRRNSSGANYSSVIETHPNPDHTNSEIMPPHLELENTPAVSMQSKSYLGYRKSTASLSKIFQRRKWRRRRASISASFNMHHNDIRVELINVNAATEEELMTLHGVNRALAQNIVNHREIIGGFRKVEDLALVSGMGASKLAQIRSEICVSRRRPGMSLASSKTTSVESIPSLANTDNTRPPSNLSKPMKQISINQANIFDFMTVNGINQALAARIIEYRERKGPFKTVDDLRRVGISRKFLSAIKIYLTTEEIESDKSSTTSTTPTRPPRHKDKLNGLRLPCNTIKPVKENELEEDIKTMYALMCQRTKRPDPHTPFSYYHNNCPAYRVASWNMENLTQDKIDNPGVMEVITRTILENRFSIVAVQEVCDKSTLQKICKELNTPTLPLNSQWTGYRGNWRFVLHHSPMQLNNMDYYLGVLYDSLKIDSVELPEANQFLPIQNGSLWQYAVFQIESYSTNWILVNVLSVPIDLKSLANGHGSVNQKEITDSVKSLVESTAGALIVGHFNAKQAQKGLSDLNDIEKVWPVENNLEQPGSMWLTSGMRQYLADDTGIVEEGLSHLAIPNGWTLGGKACKYGPVWCTLSGLPDSNNASEEDGDRTKDRCDEVEPTR